MSPIGLTVVTVWGLVAAHAILTFVLAVIQVSRQRHGDAPPPAGTIDGAEVTVLVPAFDEEQSISDCLGSLLASRVVPGRIVVLDDGSRDRTRARATAALDGVPGSCVIGLESNGGKARALNRGLALVDTPLVFTLDADTVVEPDTVGRAVAMLRAQRLDAVACHVAVRAPNRWLAALQDVEYAGTLQTERLAQSVWGGIATVPGAGGLFRTQAVRESGGFPERTRAEDTDLTLALQRRGTRVGACADALVHTEAPTTLEALIRQRERWVWGTLSALWCHVREPGRAVSRFRFAVLPYAAVLQAVWPCLYGLTLVLTPIAAFQSGGLVIPLGTVLMVAFVAGRSALAFGLARRRMPGPIRLLVSGLALPLIVLAAALQGLGRIVRRTGGLVWRWCTAGDIDPPSRSTSTSQDW